METLISTLEQIATSLRMPAVILAGIALIVGGYYLMIGGQEGKAKAKNWFIGAGVGLIIVLIASEIAKYIANQTGMPY